MTGRRPGAGERGAMFVEAMLAAAIVAVALGATLRVVADSAQRTRAVEARRAAVLVAQSELDGVASVIPLQPGRTVGVAGDLVWEVNVAPYVEGGDATDAGGLWRVAVGVRQRAGGPDLVTLQTLRLGPKA
jgi:hypothetical protein